MFARSLIALLSVACGWAAGFAVYLAIVGESSAHEWRAWAFWTAPFCIAGWVIAGLPLAFLNPDLTGPVRKALGAIAMGGIGVLMIALFFGTFLMGPITLLGFIIASVSMLVYSLLIRQR